MSSPQEAVQIVLAVIEVTQKFYRYVVDPLPTAQGNEACEDCKRYDGMRMTRREIYSLFPDLEKQSELIWLPHVHPNCRCELWLEEEETDE